MTPDEFQARLAELPQPTSETELQASEVDVHSGVWVARDVSGRPHLLVRVPGDVTALDVTSMRGLRVKLGKHLVKGNAAKYVDLASRDSATDETFAAVAAEVWTALAVASEDGRAGAVAAVVNEWRWFWDVDPGALSSPDALGLFGELWFLLCWAGVSPGSIGAWNASDGAGHDFRWADRSVEVKVTAKAGPAVHEIQHLDQLADPETGTLSLFSLTVVEDSEAETSLHSLVGSVLGQLADAPATRTDFLSKVGGRGYTRAGHGEAAVRYRVLDESLFRVADGFPRLTKASFPDGLPAAIANVSYELDMSTCTDWCVASSRSMTEP